MQGIPLCLDISDKALEKILEHKKSKEVHMIGKVFKQTEPVFNIPCSSADLGMVYCSKLDGDQLCKCPLSSLKNKCLVFCVDQSKKWGCIEDLLDILNVNTKKLPSLFVYMWISIDLG